MAFLNIFKNDYKEFAFPVNFATAIAIAIMTICYSAIAQRMTGPNTVTQAKLNDLYQSLSDFKKDCGRYPTTNEGLQALLVNPKMAVCRETSHWNNNPNWLGNPVSDAWGQIIQYTSDGASYRIQASHGYYLTNNSPKHGMDHWEHIGPVPNDLQPTKRPGKAD